MHAKIQICTFVIKIGIIRFGAFTKIIFDGVSPPLFLSSSVRRANNKQVMSCLQRIGEDKYPTGNLPQLPNNYAHLDHLHSAKGGKTVPQ